MKALLEFLLPMLYNRKTDKILKNKICNYCSDGTDSVFHNMKDVELSKTDFEKLYANTICTKNVFEDKAKANIIGITITISLITGAVNIFERINRNDFGPWIQWVSFGLYVIAVGYMLCAGIQAIRILCNDNIIYTEPVLGNNAEKKQLKEAYDDAISKNILQNQIRNNGIYTSYECIRNALLCLLIVLIVAVFPYNTIQNDKNTEKIEHTYTYSTKSIQRIKDLRIENDIINCIERHMPDDSSNEINLLVDKEHQIVIKYMVKDEIISILNVESCIID